MNVIVFLTGLITTKKESKPNCKSIRFINSPFKEFCYFILNISIKFIISFISHSQIGQKNMGGIWMRQKRASGNNLSVPFCAPYFYL